MSLEKKAMKATWDDEVQEEVTNMCFIAIDNEIKSLKLNDDYLFDDEINEKTSYDELPDDLNDLHRKCKNFLLKNVALKKKILSLTKRT